MLLRAKARSTLAQHRQARYTRYTVKPATPVYTGIHVYNDIPDITNKTINPIKQK